MTAGSKYSCPNRENLPQPIYMQSSQNWKTFLLRFYCLFEMYIKSKTIWKKRGPHSLSIFQIIYNILLRKTWLLTRLKRPLSEYTLESSLLTVPRHCWNLHGSTFNLKLKTSLLVWCEILQPFLNTLTADDKHCWNLNGSPFIIFFINLREIDCIFLSCHVSCSFTN